MYYKNCLILSFSSISIHIYIQTNNSVPTLIGVSLIINSEILLFLWNSFSGL